MMYRKMKSNKLYANRDIRKQGKHYTDHLLALTAEDLHEKSDIAAELAHRDIEIESLREQKQQLDTQVQDLTGIITGPKIHTSAEAGILRNQLETRNEEIKALREQIAQQRQKFQRLFEDYETEQSVSDEWKRRYELLWGAQSDKSKGFFKKRHPEAAEWID